LDVDKEDSQAEYGKAENDADPKTFQRGESNARVACRPGCPRLGRADGALWLSRANGSNELNQRMQIVTTPPSLDKVTLLIKAA
jgi:hypothetical protein